MTLENYMANRRYWEIGGIAFMLLTGFVANIGIVTMEHVRFGSDTATWEVVTWEGTSHLAIAAVIPLMLWFDRRFPIDKSNWRRSVPAHALFTIAWSLAHVTLMYWMRVGIYAAVDRGYRWDDWWAAFGYEYLKDFRTYFMFLAVIYLYRFALRRLQGEAGYLSEGKSDVDAVDVVDRFLIKKLGKEFLVRVGDIDWIEASGNYVNLHVGARVYPLRETMAGITQRLQAAGVPARSPQCDHQSRPRHRNYAFRVRGRRGAP